MKASVELINSQRAVSVTRQLKLLVKKTVDAVLEHEKIDFPCELTVTFLNNSKIQKLNKEFRDIEAPTDVLSFPSGDYPGEFSEDKPCYLGDIAISLERAEKQRQEYGHSLEREIAFLVAHSVLHLLGYDHIEESDELTMFAKQETILSEMGVTR